jgi:hypothetical protein
MRRLGVVALATVALVGTAACGSDSKTAAASGKAPSAVPIADPASPVPGPGDALPSDLPSDPPSASASESAGPTATAPSGHESVPAGRSRIDIALNDCEGCIVTAYVPLVKGKDLQTWVSKPVKDGRTSLVVPTASTRSMSFDVQGGKTVQLTFENARPAVVLAYRTPAGGRQEGNWCWAGTSDSVVTLTIRHSRLPASQFAGALPGEDHEDVFEARPAFPVVAGEWQPSPDGGLGHQDAPYCSAR